MMKLRVRDLQAIVVCSAGLLVSSCWTPSTRRPVDFGKARMPREHSPVVIDGEKSSKDEWAGSVAVPLKPKGRAEFLWDAKGVYVRFSGHGYWPAHDPEAVCLSITDFINSPDCRSVRFHMKEGWGRDSAMELVKVVTNRGWRNPLLPPFDRKLIQFRANPQMPAKRTSFMRWSAELFMSWELLNCKNAPRGKIIAHVYRLVVERPTSLLIMEKLQATQPDAPAPAGP